MPAKGSARRAPRPRHRPVTEADPSGHRRKRAGDAARQRPQVQAPHRRGEDRPGEVSPLDQRAERDAAAHRVRDEKPRRRQAERVGEVDQRGDVELVVGEVAHVAEHRVARVPVRQALAAPVDHRDRKAHARRARRRPCRISRRTRSGPGRPARCPRRRRARPPRAAASRPRPRSHQPSPPGGASATSASNGAPRGHPSRLPSFIARPMSPSIRSWPLMKAAVGFDSAVEQRPEGVGAGGQGAVGIAVVGRDPALVDANRAFAVDHELDRAIEPIVAEARAEGLHRRVNDLAHACLSGLMGAGPRFLATDR